MAKRRIGVWFIGAWGGVATTVIVGLLALKRGLTGTTALVSALLPFDKLDLIGWDELVLGGHEIRETTALIEARQLLEKSHVFQPHLLAQLETDLAAFDKNVRPGTLLNVGPTIESLAGSQAMKFRSENAAHAVHQLSWAEYSQQLEKPGSGIFPASSLYAVAAMRLKCPFVNFTPSVGTDCPALKEFALQQGVVHVGRDGKTGETLMKAVLAPMFAARNLQVMSWVGHNIFGNLDGKVLDDPVNKANKVRSKDHLLTEILGYKPQTLVSIEYIESMGDWKTAWDHIHFQGFLGTPMVLQFIWQGCDSLLAAPLVIDLIRFTEREARRGKSGVMSHLASFFKSPMECDEPAFAYQFQQLTAWAEDVAATSEPRA
jgi:myo-inositol-1-phosphate synthase